MECIFCSIAEKKVPSITVYEDEKSIAVLDINPRSKGMCIVMAKKHYESIEEDVESSLAVFRTAIALAKAIKKALNPLFVSIAYMPSQVKHFHLKLYPFYPNDIPLAEAEPKKEDEKTLKEIAEKIRSSFEVEEKPKETEEKGKGPRELSKEEVWWIKREISLA